MVFVAAVTAIIIGSVTFVIGHSLGRAAPTTSAPISTGPSPTSNRCETAKNLNDYQLNECLIRQIASVKIKLKTALSLEATNLRSTTLSQARQIVNAAENSFDHYVRSECLAEANPYMGGTIFPIIFGFCEISLYQQRLGLVEKQAASSLAN